ncbi:MAG: hypothetical protein KDA41_07975, partial [Planctomycetales bacterium]|nr:hypothetical protein [Planctomycetales bacterium]
MTAASRLLALPLALALLSPHSAPAAPRVKVIEGAPAIATPGEVQGGQTATPIDQGDDGAELPAWARSPTPDVWEIPALQERMARLRMAMGLLARQRQFDQAERACQQAIEAVPHDATNYFLLACTQSQQKKVDEAYLNLVKAIELGFNQTELLKREVTLAAVR